MDINMRVSLQDKRSSYSYICAIYGEGAFLQGPCRRPAAAHPASLPDGVI